MRGCGAFLFWEWTWWCLLTTVNWVAYFEGFLWGNPLQPELGIEGHQRKRKGSRRTSWLPLVRISGQCQQYSRTRTSPAGARRFPRSAQFSHRDPARSTIQMVQMTCCYSFLFESGCISTGTALCFRTDMAKNCTMGCHFQSLFSSFQGAVSFHIAINIWIICSKKVYSFVGRTRRHIYLSFFLFPNLYNLMVIMLLHRCSFRSSVAP